MTSASERRAGQPSARSVARRTCIAAAPRMITSRLVRIIQRWARRQARSSKRPNSSGWTRTIVRTLLRLLPHGAEEAPLESGEEAVHGGLQTARAGSEQRLSEQRLSKAMTH